MLTILTICFQTQKRFLKNLPDVIGLNCQVDNDTTLDFWKRQLDLIAQAHEQREPSSQNYAEPSRSRWVELIHGCEIG